MFGLVYYEVINMKTLTFNEYIKNSINYINNYIFQILVAIMKPFAQIIYKKYRLYKSYSVRKQNRIKRDFIRKVCILGVACVLGIVIAFTASVFTQDVKAENDELLHKYYTFYTVVPGDSLWEIAGDNYVLGYDDRTDYIDDVIFINHLDDADDISCGDTLVIPYYSYEVK